MDDRLKEKALEMRRCYHRQWQQKNKDAVKKYQQKYWRKKAENERKGDEK